MDEPHLDFFSAAAQVIPVIFVALAFEFRNNGFHFWPLDVRKPTTVDQHRRQAKVRRRIARYTLGMAALLGLGEAAALIVLSTGSTWSGWTWLVGGALTIGGLGVVSPVAVNQYRTLAQLRPRRARQQRDAAAADEHGPVRDVIGVSVGIVMVGGALFAVASGLVSCRTRLNEIGRQAACAKLQPEQRANLEICRGVTVPTATPSQGPLERICATQPRSPDVDAFCRSLEGP